MGNNYFVFSAVFSFLTLLFSQTLSLLLLSYILKSASALCFGMCCKRKINFLNLCAQMIKPGNKHVISLVIDRLVWHLDDVFVRDC